MKILSRFFTLATLSLAALTGCVQVATIPHVARSGDTVVLGLGGIKRNWHGETPKNLQLTITDSASNSYNLSAGEFFQAFPDYRAGFNKLAFTNDNIGKVEPYDGAWFVSTALVDSLEQPLSLATGAATIAVTADNLNVVLDDLGAPISEEGDLAAIPIEIIAGPPSSGSSNGQFNGYVNSGSHFLIRPATTPITAVGGAFYVVDYASDSGHDPDHMPVVYPVSHNPFININYTIKKNNDGSGSYRIFIYNSAGFVATIPRDVKQASLEDLGVHLEYYNPAISSVKTNFVLNATDSYFVDVNGTKITGLIAEMLHSSDL